MHYLAEYDLIDLGKQSVTDDLDELDESKYKSLLVDKPCELETLLSKHPEIPHEPGCIDVVVYYEFTRDISEDKKVILRDEVTLSLSLYIT